MSSPYLTTLLHTKTYLNPEQMNNNVYNNLKQNLIKQLEGKCFRQYGYISKVYNITDYGVGNIPAENPLAAAIFKVTYSCKLCNPLKNTQMVCKIDRTSPILISLLSGPMRIVVTMEHINKNSFYLDKHKNLMYKSKTGSNMIEKGAHVKVTILSKTFNDQDDSIMVFGRLDDIANTEEIETFYKDEYDTNINEDKIINFDDYIQRENELNDIIEGADNVNDLKEK
jgi:DNA-directed RNA polymerase subunit E'/Rpb7